MNTDTSSNFNVPGPEPTPPEVIAAAYRAYRKHTRPYRRVFAGIMTRREAERFIKSRLAKQDRALREAGVSE